MVLEGGVGGCAMRGGSKVLVEELEERTRSRWGLEIGGKVGGVGVPLLGGGGGSDVTKTREGRKRNECS